MDQEEIRRAARAIVATMAGGPVADDDSLIVSGKIDSLSILKLIAQLEQRLRVHMPTDALQPEDFDSVDLIVETVERVARPR
jgi:acyl carrier protein